MLFKIKKITLDPDLDLCSKWAKIQVSDPNSMSLDPQHWFVCMVGRMDELVTFGQGDLTEQDSVGQGEEE